MTRTRTRPPAQPVSSLRFEETKRGLLVIHWPEPSAADIRLTIRRHEERALRRQARNLRLVATGGLRLRMVEPCTCGVRHEAEFEHAPASLPPGFAFEVRG